MESTFLTATLWLALAVASALIASSLRLSIALVEICVAVITPTQISTNAIERRREDAMGGPQGCGEKGRFH